MKYLQPLTVLTTHITSSVFLRTKWWDLGSRWSYSGTWWRPWDLRALTGWDMLKVSNNKKFHIFGGDLWLIFLNSDQFFKISRSIMSFLNLSPVVVFVSVFFPQHVLGGCTYPWAKWHELTNLWRSKLSHSLVSGSDSELKESVHV